MDIKNMWLLKFQMDTKNIIREILDGYKKYVAPEILDGYKKYNS